MTVVGHAVAALFAAVVIVSVVTGNWTLALLHTHTLVLVLVFYDDVKLRRRVRALEDELRELIEN